MEQVKRETADERSGDRYRRLLLTYLEDLEAETDPKVRDEKISALVRTIRRTIRS